MKSDEINEQQANAGANRQIEQIYREYGKRVFRFCYRLSGNVADAEDLASEVFLAACKGHRRFQSRSKVLTWLFQISIHKFHDMRSERKIATLPIDSVEASGETPSLQMMELETALRKLPTAELESLLLVKVEGFKYREAAKILQVPQGTIQYRVHEAMKKLRDIFGDAGESFEAEPSEIPLPNPQRCAHEM